MANPAGPVNGRPLVYGHRGASAYARENTLEAFTLAMEQGADGVELDVRFTADAEIVIHHDALTPELGSIIDFSFQVVRERAPHIPRLDEALAVLGDPALINIEIKNGASDKDFDPERRMAGEVVDMVNALGLADRVLVSSFDPASVERVRELDATIPTGLLLPTGTDLTAVMAAAAAAGHACINPALADMNDERAAVAVQAAEDHGLNVIVWTVDEPGDVIRLDAAGVAGIITNDPPAVLASLR